MAGFTRRQVLRTAAFGVLTTAPVLRQLAFAPAGASTTLKRSAFAPYVGKTFKVVADKIVTVAVLASVGDLTGAPPGAETQFRARFEHVSGPPDRPQGIYNFKQRRFGAALLFAVPVHRPGTPPVYEVVVNAPARAAG